ncbi:MAG: non-canonical purine NTP pyrophosphatase, partial [Pygmaiobacter sp.]
VDALGGAPGIYSARYCGRHGDDEGNNNKLIAAIRDIPPHERSAKFVSAVCLYFPDGECNLFLGECPGRVDTVRRGTNGFGYDPLFVPDLVGCADGTLCPNTDQRSYAELRDEEKDAISHRGNALRAMQSALDALLRAQDKKTTVTELCKKPHNNTNV